MLARSSSFPVHPSLLSLQGESLSSLRPKSEWGRTGQREVTKTQISRSKTSRKRSFKEGKMSCYQTLPAGSAAVLFQTWGSDQRREPWGRKGRFYSGERKPDSDTRARAYGMCGADQPQSFWRARETLGQETEGCRIDRENGLGSLYCALSPREPGVSSHPATGS